jgi:hypothetical protein
MEREDEIRRKAHELWERDGRPEGRADDHWAEAEALIGAEGVSEEPVAQPPLKKGATKRGKSAGAAPASSEDA